MESLIISGAGLPYGIVQPGDEFENGVPIIRPVDVLNGTADITQLKHTDPAISEAYKRTILTGNEVLITVRATIGRTMVTDRRFAGMNVTRGIAVIRQDSEQIDPHYLNAFLNSPEAQNYIQSNAKGATLKGLNLDLLRKMKIMVPQMEIQEEFIDFSKQVDKSRFIAKRLFSKFDCLVKSRFIEMFGNLDINDKHWEMSTIGRSASVPLHYGSTASAIDYDSETRYVRITDIDSDGKLNDDFKSPSSYDSSYLLNKGDILFARSGSVGVTYLFKTTNPFLLDI